jgi:hypothetical protein
VTANDGAVVAALRELGELVKESNRIARRADQAALCGVVVSLSVLVLVVVLLLA